jgi:rod shape-determining protein MreC
VLALLVAVSLILLTAYFGESPGSPLHAVQRGVVEVLSPIQDGASRALKPVRDLFGWFSDTLHAKKQRDQLRKQVVDLRAQNAQLQQAQVDNVQLRKLVGLDTTAQLEAYSPLAARVITRSPTLWYQQIEVDMGSSDGVRVDQPVVGDGGLVGKVTDVTPGAAVITLITDPSSGVSAQVLEGRRSDFGVVVPTTGDPNNLVLQLLPHNAPVQVGNLVVTSGTRTTRLQSLFPPDIPVGTVTRVSADELASTQQVHLHPVVDLQHLDFVQILTRRVGSSTVAKAP